MNQPDSYTKVIHILKFKLKFNKEKLDKMAFFANSVLKFNKKYNLVSKSTEKAIWSRHILDSAQLVKFIDFFNGNGVSDLGSGAGFPGIVLGIYNPNYSFHVKLYEKSPVKCEFLRKNISNLKLKIDVIEGNVNSMKIASDYIVCRAFKKIPELLRISRENIKKPNKLIVLKGKKIENEVKNAFIREKIRYKITESITEAGSKILIIKN